MRRILILFRCTHSSFGSIQICVHQAREPLKTMDFPYKHTHTHALREMGTQIVNKRANSGEHYTLLAATS